MTSIIKIILSLTISALIIFSAGFFWFIAKIPKEATTLTQHYDLIVVLTGGKHRIDKGLELMKQNPQSQLLLSGVHRSSRAASLGDHNIDKQRVIFGVLANSTYLNAIETQLVTNVLHSKKLALVTSNYHMPRSQLVFSHMLPNLEIQAVPVFTENFSITDILFRKSNFLLVAKEYIKFLLSVLYFWSPADNMAFYLHESQKGQHNALIALKNLQSENNSELFNNCTKYFAGDLRYCKLISRH